MSVTFPPTRHLRFALILPFFALAGCDLTKGKGIDSAPKTPGQSQGADGTDIASAAPTGTAPQTPGATVSTSPVPAPKARSAAEMNTTSQAERRDAAAAPSSSEKRLGTTVASLGDPTLPGFWIKTPLVKAEGDGRLLNPANGKSAKVRLMPLGGAAGGGSQVSLPALQLLGVSLTDLPTLEVYGS